MSEQAGAPYTFTFGKHRGKTIEQVAAENPKYLQWIYENTQFGKDNRDLLYRISKRRNATAAATLNRLRLDIKRCEV